MARTRWFRKLADGTIEKIDEIVEIRAKGREAFGTQGRSFNFAKAAWLLYLDKKIDYSGVLSPEAQETLLNRRSSPATLLWQRPGVSGCSCGRKWPCWRRWRLAPGMCRQFERYWARRCNSPPAWTPRYFLCKVDVRMVCRGFLSDV